jgi:spore coat protein CotH
MNRKRLYQGTGLLLTGVLLITGLAGCGQVLGQEEDAAPFYDDRVVTVYLVMDEDDWGYMQQNAISEEYAKADLWYDGELIPDVAVRPKGNSSLKSAVSSDTPRFSLKVDLNFFNSSRNLDGVKKLNFNNGFSDPTLIRETLAYEIFEQVGVPTPRTSFVDLWINDTHLGLYTMVEQIDKTFLDNHFDDNSGNLYKPEMLAGRLDWTEADLGPEPAGQSEDDLDVNLGGGKLREIMEALEGEPTEEEAAAPGGMPGRDMMPGGGMAFTQQGNLLEQMGLKTNENNPDHSALFRLLDVLNNEPDKTFPEEIEKVLDVDQVLRFLAVSAAIVHLDNYIGIGHNYYLYEVDGKFTIIPWDLNMAFGTFNSGIDRDGLINFYIDEPTAGAVANYPLVSRLLSVPSYLETYHGYLEELINGPFSEEAMNSRIDELAELIRPYVEADELKFYPTEVWETALSEDIARGGQGGIEVGMFPIGLKAFVAERVASIRQQLDGKLPSSSGDGSGNGGNMTAGGQIRGQGGRMPGR